MQKVNIYTDGASKGNPGPGGFGTIIEFQTNTVELSKGYDRTTNNRMELMGAIAGLEYLNSPCQVVITSDSRYLVDAFNKCWVQLWIRNGWKTSSGNAVKNIDLWKRLLKAMEPHSVRFIWVKGHSGNPMNERCDWLATSSVNDVELLQDGGFYDS